MGTSGAYGGSNAQSWSQAQDAVAALPANGPASPQQVHQAVQQLAAAVHRLFPAPRTATTYTHEPSALLGRPTRTDGAQTGGRTRSSGGGMSSANAARGGAVVWAGHALNNGSQADLDALGVGLRLADMQALTQSERCRYILDKVLGPPGSPDEEVLRQWSPAEWCTSSPGE